MSQFMGSVELRLSKVEGHEEKLGAFNRSFVETFGHIWEEGYTNGMSWMLGYTSEERAEREKELFAGTCSELSEDDMSDTASYHLVQCYVEGLAQEVPAIGCRAYAYLHADYIWGGEFEIALVCASKAGSRTCDESVCLNDESYLKGYEDIIEESPEVSRLYGEGFDAWEKKYNRENVTIKPAVVGEPWAFALKGMKKR